MSDLFRLIVAPWSDCSGCVPRCKSEILVLRHQLNVLRRRSPKPVTVSNIDRLVFAGLYRLTPRTAHLSNPRTMRWPRSFEQNLRVAKWIVALGGRVWSGGNPL